MFQRTGSLGSCLADGIVEQSDELFYAARLADRDLVLPVRVACQPAKRVRRTRRRIGARALRQQSDERQHAVRLSDGVLVLGVVVREVTQCGGRVRRRLHPVVRLLHHHVVTSDQCGRPLHRL